MHRYNEQTGRLEMIQGDRHPRLATSLAWWPEEFEYNDDDNVEAGGTIMGVDARGFAFALRLDPSSGSLHLKPVDGWSSSFDGDIPLSIVRCGRGFLIPCVSGAMYRLEAKSNVISV